MKTIVKQLITIKSIPVLVLVLLVVLGSSFVKGTGQDPEPRPVYHAAISLYSVEDDIAAIQETGMQYALAMQAGDLDLYVSLYTDDTVKMQPDEPAIFGKEDLRASFKTLFDNFTIEEMGISDGAIQVAGDWAFSRCNFTVTLTPKAGGEPLYMDCKDLCILKRQADGSWKYYWDCWNSNVPPTVE